MLEKPKSIDNKTKQTLYNFTSLRSPQSVKTHERELLFIDIPSTKKIVVFDGGKADLEKLITANSISNDKKKAKKPLNKKLSGKSFIEIADYISENKTELRYNFFDEEKISSIPNISPEIAKLLFILLIQNMNDENDFDLKECICKWLTLWHIIEKFNNIDDLLKNDIEREDEYNKKHNLPSLTETGSLDKFKNDFQNKCLNFLLNATIILPLPKDDNKNETINIERKGPIFTSFEKSISKDKFSFISNDLLDKTHEINLTSTILQIDKSVIQEQIVEYKNRILSNIDFSKQQYFFAGSSINTETKNSELGAKVSVFIATNDASIDEYYLMLTSNKEYENNKIPYNATIYIKSNSDFDNTNLFDSIEVINRKWFIKLKKDFDLRNLNYDVNNFFVQLNFAGGVEYCLTVQLSKYNTYWNGSGALIKSNAIPFLAKINGKKGKDWSLEIRTVDVSYINKIKSNLEEIECILEDKYDKHLFNNRFDISQVVFSKNKPTDKEYISLNFTLEKFDDSIYTNRNFDAFVIIKLKSNDTYYSIPFTINWNNDNGGDLSNSFFMVDDGVDKYGKTYAPKGFGITQLGVADYQRVVSHVTRYEAGEVAHVENLMMGEYKEKIVTKEHIMEVTNFDSLETETEQLNDSNSSERFQMQSEIAKIQHEQNSTNIDAHASYNGGTTSLSINYGNSTSTSKEDSNKQSITNAKELTKRAMERIVTKIKKEQTVKVTDKLTEVTNHGFDNRGGKEHVSGVYRYINAIYKNEIENYGKRLAYEFSIPEPSRLHNLGISANIELENLNTLEKPIDPRKILS